MPPVPKLKKSNTSGFVGVSWNTAANKWGARIRLGGRYVHLGLFKTPEEAHDAYVAAALAHRQPDDAPEVVRARLLARVLALYEEHGPSALSTRFLHRQKGQLYVQLRQHGLTQPVYLDELGLTDVFRAWRDQHRKYRGKVQPTWTWEQAVARAKEVTSLHGSLPTLEWFRHRDNGLTSLPNGVFRTGHTWQDLRDAVGDLSIGAFVESRNRMRWRSRPEACLSDFLHARGIEHKAGRRYDDGYAEVSGKRYGLYDLHFVGQDGRWIDVEVWGNLDALSEGGYSRTKAQKQAWHEGNAQFVGIEHNDCMSDARLTEILRPYIGDIAPFRFERPHDPVIQTTHWSGADELLATCKEFAARMPDGIFPSEDWLRKRGKYANREGETYGTLAHYVNLWIGGTRNVREFLGQSHASTTKWSPELALSRWQHFEATYGVSPSQCLSPGWRKKMPREVVNEASAIYAAASRHNVRDAARQGMLRHPVKWTPETTEAAWLAFEAKHGAIPSSFMSSVKRRSLPRAVTDEATRIYEAAQRLGMLATLRSRSRRSL